MNASHDSFFEPPSREVAELVERVCLEALPDDLTRLFQIVTADQSARKFYVRYMQMHATLPWVTRNVSEAFNRESQAAVEMVKSPAAFARPMPLRIGRSLRIKLSSTWAAICVVAIFSYGSFALIAWNLRPAKSDLDAPMAQRDLPPSERAVVAKLTAAHDCVWGDASGQGQNQPGQSLRSDDVLELQSGDAQVTFKDGAVVALEGPARFVVTESDRGTLTRGKLAARVPHAAIGFRVQTPTAQVVDLGTEFAVDVADTGATVVFVRKGAVAVNQTAPDEQPAAQGVRLTAGNALRISAREQSLQSVVADAPRFVRAFARLDSPEHDDETPFAGPVMLGNLFDDSHGTPLRIAMQTDTFGATAEIDDLGVQCAFYGGDAVKSIAPQLRFDLSKLGWTQDQFAQATNDAAVDRQNYRQDGTKQGISTRGVKLTPTDSMEEQGIGLHANGLVTFDLRELRVAGKLGNRPLRFVCERAGTPDFAFGAPLTSIHMAAIVSEADRVLSAIVDGKATSVSQRNGVWELDSSPGEPLRANGRFASFVVDLPESAEYLTLLTTCAGNGLAMDQAVWSGARLEAIPTSDSVNPGK